MRLTSDQEESILRYSSLLANRFKKELSEKSWKEDRTGRHNLFSEFLSKENIDNLTETDFRKIYKSLWALKGWTNKDWVIDNIIKNNGFSKVRSSLGDLLYGSGVLSERFNRFKIKGMGP